MFVGLIRSGHKNSGTSFLGGCTEGVRGVCLIIQGCCKKLLKISPKCHIQHIDPIQYLLAHKRRATAVLIMTSSSKTCPFATCYSCSRASMFSHDRILLYVNTYVCLQYSCPLFCVTRSTKQEERTVAQHKKERTVAPSPGDTIFLFFAGAHGEFSLLVKPRITTCS